MIGKFVTFTVLLLMQLVASHASPMKTERPNIVFVLTDDQRWDAAGFASGGVVWSPGLDKLRIRRGGGAENFSRTQPALASN